MIITRPLRLMTLHFSQMGFTEGFTFMMLTSFITQGASYLERQVVGRHFHRDLVAGQDADEVGPQLAGNVSHNHMAVGLTLFVEEFNLEHSVGHGLPNDTFYFDDIFFRQADCLLEGFRQFCAAS
jgi:hypothetical protein